MATEALIVLAVGVVGTVFGGGIVLYRLVRRVRHSLEATKALYQRLEPRLERFQQDADVRDRELDRLGHALAGLTVERRRRRV